MTADFIASLHGASLPLGIEFLPLFRGFVMVLFVLASLILMLVVLIQEGKGGGIAGAFGGAAAETFGVKAGSVNRFTAILAAVFVGLALLHAGLASSTPTSVIATPATPAPVARDRRASPPEAPPPTPTAGRWTATRRPPPRRWTATRRPPTPAAPARDGRGDAARRAGADAAPAAPWTTTRRPPPRGWTRRRPRPRPPPPAGMN